MNITAEIVEAVLLQFLDRESEEVFAAELGTEVVFPVDHVQTFEDAGLMTRSRGVVLRFADGSEFQITIMQSRPGRPSWIDTGSGPGYPAD